jgi:hypothetical protein
VTALGGGARRRERCDRLQDQPVAEGSRLLTGQVGAQRLADRVEVTGDRQGTVIPRLDPGRERAPTGEIQERLAALRPEGGDVDAVAYRGSSATSVMTMPP